MIIDLAHDVNVEVGDLIEIDDKKYLIITNQDCDMYMLFDVIGMFVIDEKSNAISDLLYNIKYKILAKGDDLKITLK